MSSSPPHHRDLAIKLLSLWALLLVAAGVSLARELIGVAQLRHGAWVLPVAFVVATLVSAPLAVALYGMARARPWCRRAAAAALAGPACVLIPMAWHAPSLAEGGALGAGILLLGATALSVARSRAPGPAVGLGEGLPGRVTTWALVLAFGLGPVLAVMSTDGPFSQWSGTLGVGTATALTVGAGLLVLRGRTAGLVTLACAVPGLAVMWVLLARSPFTGRWSVLEPPAVVTAIALVAALWTLARLLPWVARGLRSDAGEGPRRSLGASGAGALLVAATSLALAVGVGAPLMTAIAVEEAAPPRAARADDAPLIAESRFLALARRGPATERIRCGTCAMGIARARETRLVELFWSGRW